MNQRAVSIVLLILGISLSFLFFKIRADDRQELLELTAARGDPTNCFLDDGTCLHDRLSTTFLIGQGVALALFCLGTYLLFFDTSKELIEKQAAQNMHIASALHLAEEEKKKDVAFTAFLAGFDEDEQKVLKAIKEQDGILQSTLRFRTGLTKTDVSLILKKLEEKKIISKKEEGNSYKVFLRKVF